jgi:FAD/FMN-containing dehydrogenase
MTTHATPGAAHPLPELDGRLEPPRPSESFGHDFGRLVPGAPRTVLRAGSVEDVARIVAHARRHGLTVAVNGQGGRDDQRESHSLYGQALVDDGIAVDAKSLDAIHHIGHGYADVDAGVRWSSLVRAAYETGQTPPVVNDFPYLSVGGTLSIGGLGATSHRDGSQADNVEELQVVTGRGEIVTCSPRQHRALFDAVRAGAGQFGLIVRAKVRLVPAPTTVRAVKVLYDDRDTYLNDAIALMRAGGVDEVNGAVIPDEGGGWRYALLAAMYHTPPAAPAPDALDGLSAEARVDEPQDVPYLAWLFRLDALWDQLQADGHWAQAKPRFTVFVPPARASELADAVLAELTPDDLGAGGVRLAPCDSAAITVPSFVLPDPAGPVVELTIGRFPAPDHPDIPGLLAQNRRFYDRAVALGAKRYLYGAIPDMTPDDWQRHYGDRWPALRALKAELDPDLVLTPGQRIFG